MRSSVKPSADLKIFSKLHEYINFFKQRKQQAIRSFVAKYSIEISTRGLRMHSRHVRTLQWQ